MADIPAARALADLLDDIHAAACSGNLAALPALADRLDRALAAKAPVLGPEAARDLRRKAMRNEACLRAAARGLQAARLRLTEISRAVGGGNIYGGDGRARPLSAPSARLTTRL